MRIRTLLLGVLCFSYVELFALNTPKIIHLTRKDDLYVFDLDFGLFEIKQVQAVVDSKYSSVRLPASASKSGRGKPEIDFLGADLEKAILEKLGADAFSGTVPARGLSLNFEKVSVPPTSAPQIFLATLEQVENRRGIKLAYGEVWLDKSLALRVSLMESKWSSDSYHWWIAYPAQYNQKTSHYDELIVIKDKEFKRKILDLVREAYRKRYD